jgi:hypothetical protein
MKLRIRSNSLRLRVTRPELEQLASAGRIVETVPFPGGAELRYELRIDAAAKALGAYYRDNLISVRIPIADFRTWQREDQVSLHGAGDLTGGLTLLVEKDFACLVTREGEDDSNAFAHPKGNT